MTLALLAGLLIAVQTTAVSSSTGRSAPLVVSALVHVSGLAVAVAWLTTRSSWAELSTAALTPWWLIGGAVGFPIVAAVASAANRMGLGAALAVVTATQLLGGLLVDAVRGGVTLGARHAAGAILLTFGAYLVAGR